MVTRRHILALLPPLAIAGCATSRDGTDTGSSPTASPPDTTTRTPTRSPTATLTPPPPPPAEVIVGPPGSDACEAVESTTPTATGGWTPVPYPPYPDRFRLWRVIEWAEDYEYARQYNRYVEQFGDVEKIDYIEVYPVDSYYVFRHGGAYNVGIDGQVDIGDTDTPEDGESPAPSGHSPFAAWYYLAERFVLRMAREDFPERYLDLDFREADVIVCAF